MPESPAWHAFNSWKANWKVATKESMWIQVSCPEPVRVYKYALRGLSSNNMRIYNWKLYGRRDSAGPWLDIDSSGTDRVYIGNVVQFFEVNYKRLCTEYKLEVAGADGSNPGLSYFQIFTLDGIYSSPISVYT